MKCSEFKMIESEIGLAQNIDVTLSFKILRIEMCAVTQNVSLLEAFLYREDLQSSPWAGLIRYNY